MQYNSPILIQRSRSKENVISSFSPDLKRDYSEHRTNPLKRRGIIKLSNNQLLTDPRNSNIFNIKSSSINEKNLYEEMNDSALIMKKKMIRDLREFRPPSMEMKKISNSNPIIGNEITDLLEKQNELFKKLVGTNSRKKTDSFKKAAEKYEERISELEKSHFSNAEIINLQNQLLEMKKNTQIQEPWHEENYLQAYIYKSMAILLRKI